MYCILIFTVYFKVYTAVTVATYSPKTELENYIRKHMSRFGHETTNAGNNTTLSQVITVIFMHRISIQCS